MSNTDVIRELTKLVASLEAQLINARIEIVRVDFERQKAFATLIEVDKRLAVVEEKFAEFRRVGEEKDRRRWTVALALIAGLVSLVVGIVLWWLKK